MSVKFSDKEKEVFRNIISGVESGGMEYAGGDYAAFAEAYENSSTEYAITLGKWQAYGPEAHELVERIQKKYPSVFKKLDTAGIAEDLAASDWSYYQISRNSDKAKCIIKIISSTQGKQCQEEQFDETVQKLHDYVYSLGITDHQAIAMASNWSYQGGPASVTRILKKTNKPYNLDNLYAACQTDTDPSYVGYYKNRQRCVYTWIKQYWPKSTTNTVEESSASLNNNATGGKNMAKTYPAGYLSNSGHDENYSYANGQAGDNTETEWELRTWYSYPWDCILRHPNAEVRQLIAELGIEAALNNKIGYDQYERTTFWYQLAKSGYHPKNITVACEADCSAGVAAICKAVGYLVGDSKMAGISPENWTGSMKAAFRSAGFEVLTASKYLTSSDYILAGDILLNETHHTCICISSGAKSGEDQTTYDGSSSNSGSTSSDDDSLNTTVKSKLYANKNNVALRTWAGVENSQLKSFPTVNRNQELGLCDTIKADDGSTWYFVKIEDKYGFVDSTDVSTSKVSGSTNNDNISDSVVVNGVKMTLSDGSSFNTKKRKWVGRVNVDKGKTLKLRQWPAGQPLVTLPKVKRGTKVYVYDAMLDDDGDIWLYIKTKNPTTGAWTWAFAYAAYISKI